MKWLVVVGLIWLAWRYLRPKPAARPIRHRDEQAARALLGVAPEADAAAIRSAHRRLLADVHPDRGGSHDLARRANAARDLLLARTGARTGG